ncbi:microcin c7 self-immunity protein mccf [Purpureocillium lavendulum]|uniref:Microcin c7 self-immunity protein mccf n=1 Tax=Purpureocillium lavendulum TaxID=1247861 RepID=A0AB34G0A3_9HYPO|nr:microcin c7 self-immunity protein mccf [Purpureocillium lavendulum]
MIGDLQDFVADIGAQAHGMFDLDDFAATEPAPRGTGSFFTWSDTGSVARRSSPIRPGETPGAAWYFDDESLPALSSTKSARTNLPDTAPLPSFPSPDKQFAGPATKRKKVDFSETATTADRSSPYRASDRVEQVFDYFERGSGH